MADNCPHLVEGLEVGQVGEEEQTGVQNLREQGNEQEQPAHDTRPQRLAADTPYLQTEERLYTAPCPSGSDFVVVFDRRFSIENSQRSIFSTAHSTPYLTDLAAIDQVGFKITTERT